MTLNNTSPTPNRGKLKKARRNPGPPERKRRRELSIKKLKKAVLTRSGRDHEQRRQG
jgi:hypothetical protein